MAAMIWCVPEIYSASSVPILNIPYTLGKCSSFSVSRFPRPVPEEVPRGCEHLDTLPRLKCYITITIQRSVEKQDKLKD